MKCADRERISLQSDRNSHVPSFPGNMAFYDAHCLLLFRFWRVSAVTPILTGDVRKALNSKTTQV